MQHLEWFDVLMLTALLWGESILSSTMAYIALIQGTATVEGGIAFSAADNYGALIRQAALLALALLYLWMRRFDFNAWTVKFSPKAVVCGILVFIASALLFDLYMLLASPLQGVLPFPGPIEGFFGSKTVSTVLYSMLNGVYEELYFLGICLAVKPKDLTWAVPFSLLVRVSFHTYQGMLSALGIGLLFGGFICLLYRRSKDKNLLPFFITHMIGDIIGLGLISRFWT